MATTTTPVCTIDADGIHKPSFDECLDYLKNGFKEIYGNDIYIDNDSQDGQLIGVYALAIDDANAMAVRVYNAFSPSTAQGVGLSRNVKINGIRRKIPSYSTVDVIVVGQAGTIIAEGSIVADENQSSWILPYTVIPYEGQVTITATAAEIGAVTAGAFSIDTIVTKTQGWQQVYNPYPATPGAPVETDVKLRQRQTVSTMIPANSVPEGMEGSLRSLPGVGMFKLYQNFSSVTDELGIPAHSVAVVIGGGNQADIVTTIAKTKGNGVGTYGTTTETYFNNADIPRQVSFSRPVPVPVTVSLKLKALQFYTIDIENKIKQSVSDWINSLGVGKAIQLTKIYNAANLYGSSDSETFDLEQPIYVARSNAPPGTADLAMAYDEYAFAQPHYVSITVK